MDTKSTYQQVKIKDCKAPPFSGLWSLGMAYGEVVAEETSKWLESRKDAVMGRASRKLALCHNQGYQLRRVETDGTLLRVFDWEKDEAVPDSLIPVALLGKNLEMIEESKVVEELAKRGANRCKFTVKNAIYQGYVLDWDKFSAAWDEDRGRPLDFRNPGTRKSNAKILERLPGPDGSPPRTTVLTPMPPAEVAVFVERIKVLVSSLDGKEADHFLHLPTKSAWQENTDFIGAWTVYYGGQYYAVRLETQTKAPGNDSRGCCMIERLRNQRSKSSNTPDVTLTSKTTKAGELFLMPRLKPSEWVKLRAEIARTRISVDIADGCILVGRLSDPEFLKRVLTAAKLVADIRR